MHSIGGRGSVSGQSIGLRRAVDGPSQTIRTAWAARRRPSSLAYMDSAAAIWATIDQPSRSPHRPSAVMAHPRMSISRTNARSAIQSAQTMPLGRVSLPCSPRTADHSSIYRMPTALQKHAPSGDCRGVGLPGSPTNRTAAKRSTRGPRRFRWSTWRAAEARYLARLPLQVRRPRGNRIIPVRWRRRQATQFADLPRHVRQTVASTARDLRTGRIRSWRRSIHIHVEIVAAARHAVGAEFRAAGTAVFAFTKVHPGFTTGQLAALFLNGIFRAAELFLVS